MFSAQPQRNTLTSLGFDEESCQTFEWFKAYPAAHHLLDAIETSFTPDCLLTEAEALDYAKATKACPTLPSDDLQNVSAPLIDAPEVLDVDHERRRQLESAQQRLALLKSQRNVLKEAIAQKRARTKQPVVTTSKTDPAKTKNSLLRLRLKLDELRSNALEERHISYPDETIGTYIAKEKGHMQDIVSFASQTLDEGKTSSEDESVSKREIQRVVRSYAEIRSDQCRHEANLVRTTAILSALNNGEAGLESSMSSLQYLIKDLQAKSSKEIETKVKWSADMARNSLLNRVRHFALAATLKEQENFLDISKFCVTAFRNQRVRVLSFRIASLFQREVHQSLNEQLYGISEMAVGVVAPQRAIERMEMGGKVSAEDERESAESELTGSVARYLDARDGDNFSFVVNAVSQLSGNFRNKMGGGKKWLYLDSHPRFPILVGELQDLLMANGAALESLLQEKCAILDGSVEYGGPDRRWVHFLNSGSS